MFIKNKLTGMIFEVDEKQLEMQLHNPNIEIYNEIKNAKIDENEKKEEVADELNTEIVEKKKRKKVIAD